MRKTWSIGTGCALFALCLPALALAAPTQAELKQKAAAHQAQVGVSAKAPAKKLDKQAIKAQRAKKTALIEERKALRHQFNQTGDPAVRQQLMAKRAQTAAVNAELRAAKKGGAKL